MAGAIDRELTDAAKRVEAAERDLAQVQGQLAAARQGAPIPIPPATLARLEALIVERNTIDGQIEAIVATLRDALGVPGDYVIGDIRQGFVPPPASPQEG